MTDPRLLQLADLPDHLLGTVSSFLPCPNAALLAASFVPSVVAALDAGDGPSPSPSSIPAFQKTRAIVGGREGTWNVLDYGEIEPELAARLTDEDLDASLQVYEVIDAGNELKTLRLTGCVNITGAGLLPLTGSTTIEVLDLSLTRKGDNPRLNAQRPKISLDLVLPILESIILRENEGSIILRDNESHLKQLVLPKKWRSSGSADLDRFLEMYNAYLDNKGLACTICDQNCLAMSNGDHGEVTWSVDDWVCLRANIGWVGWIGMQSFGCHGCNDTICYRCDWISQNEHGHRALKYCGGCEKEHCHRCVSEYWQCPNLDCQKELCNACKPDESAMSCSGCQMQIQLTECSVCQPRCDSCGDVYCDSCSDAAHLERCAGCDDKICIQCRRAKCREDFSTCCAQCLRIVVPYLDGRLMD